jgi:VWFA-related protein
MIITAAAALLALAASPPGQDVRFRETVNVERVVVDARVVDGSGQPILGLSPADFRVVVSGREVPLESAQWIAGPALRSDAGPGATGHLLVLFFQKSLEPSRAPGLLRMIARVREVVRRLGPGDRVAVVSFDSHLKLWVDFTSDHGRVERGLQEVLFGGPPAEGPTPERSLAAHLDAEKGRRAASPERALLVLARALREVPGNKSVVLVGHGFGELDVLARRTLEDARATVFAFDVTEADAHTLESGLKQVADETGGFYERTHRFAGAAVARLERALVGHYVLTFPRPILPFGEHAVAIKLVGRRGTVLAKRNYRG